MLRVAFYKGNHAGYRGIFDRGIRLWTKSQYSHCELVFSDGLSASSSITDGGVRFKNIGYSSGNWDFITVPSHLEKRALAWFKEHEGDAYDYIGLCQFMVSPIRDGKRKSFCSEAVASALGFEEPYRYSPGVLAVTLTSFNNLIHSAA